MNHLGPRCLLDRARIMTIIIETEGAVINAHLSSQDGISSTHLITLRGREERGQRFCCLVLNMGETKAKVILH